MNTSNLRKILFILNGVIIFLIPLIVYVKIYRIPSDSNYHLTTLGIHGLDLFAFYKAKLLQYGALLSISLTFYLKNKEGYKLSLDKYTILSGLFAISIIISLLLSDYKATALIGYGDRFEGAWTWLSYLILSYSLYLLVESKEDVKKIIIPFVLSSGVVSLIGIGQYYGYDIFDLLFVKKIIFGPYFDKLKSCLVFKATVYSTLYNPNYIGSMMVLAIPLSIECFKSTSKKYFKAMCLVVCLSNFITLIISRSSAGLLGFSVVITLFVLSLMVRKKQIKYIIGVIVIAVTTLLFFNSHYNGRIIREFDLSTLFIESPKNVENIDVRGRDMKVEFLDGLVINVRNEDGIVLTDGSNEEIGYQFKEVSPNRKLVIENEKYRGINMYLNTKDNSLNIEYAKAHIKVVLVDDGYKIFHGDKLISTDDVKVFELIKNEKSMNCRGYIWNRSIPLIFNKPVFGHGSDTFAMEFPQNDILGRVNIPNLRRSLVNKIHNTPLQVLFNFGLFGGVIMIALIGCSVMSKDVSLGIKLSVAGYIVTSLFNESVVATTFMFFILIGVMLRVNDINKSEQESLKN